MLQLFLVPGLIVVVLVAIALAWRWLFGGPVSKADFLDKLHNDNAEVRWRAAEQLAQVLQRDDALASDGDFARQLGLMLLETRDRSREAEKDFLDSQKSIDKQRELTEQQRKEKVDAERTKVEADRTFISFLTASLGDFLVPVGAPVLKEIAAGKDGLDPKALVLRRRQAVWRWPTSAKTSSASTRCRTRTRTPSWTSWIERRSPRGWSTPTGCATPRRRSASAPRAAPTTWASATC